MDAMIDKNLYGSLLTETRLIVETARRIAYNAINTTIVERNWQLGKRIYEEELQEKNLDTMHLNFDIYCLGLITLFFYK